MRRLGKSPSSLAPDEPDRQQSGFVRLEAIIGELFADDALLQKEVLTAYRAIYLRVAFSQGRSAALYFLDDCMEHLAALSSAAAANQDAE